MRTEYKHNPPIPYSLHDMRVKKIIIQDKTIVLEFEDGYEKLTEPFEQVEGNITIEGVDFDCTCVMLQSKWGNYGKFNGEKLELERFIKRYKNYSFEIVDELYGYNQVLYSGYLSILETEDLVQSYKGSLRDEVKHKHNKRKVYESVVRQSQLRLSF